MPVLLPPALELSLDLLRCSTCRTHRLQPGRGALRCPAGHTFDIARHGYAALLTGTRATSGDDAAMVRARERFLSSGGYAPIRRVPARLAAGSVHQRATVLVGSEKTAAIGNWGPEHSDDLAKAVSSSGHVTVRVGGRAVGSYDLAGSAAAYGALMRCDNALASAK